MPLLCDTGVVYALADRHDAWHGPVRRYLESHPDTLLLPMAILAEVAYLLRERIGNAAEVAFAGSLAAGEVAVEKLATSDFPRTVELMKTYPSLGLVDATIVATAERLKLTSIATTDRRHFGSVRPAHTLRFTLVP
jgi:predicted nucleic acid-binding protein